MKKIKAVIFDLDGTIGDTIPLCLKAFRQAVEPLINRSVSDGEIIATFGPSEEGTIMTLAPNHYDEGIAEYLKYYKKFHSMCPAPFEGIKDLLEMLKDKGIHIAMVTGKGKHSTAISLKKFEIENYFELIETGVISGPSKPQGIQRILKSYDNICNDEFIYVGDAPSDIIACKDVGVFVVSAAWDKYSDTEKLLKLCPDKIFSTINEFSDWVGLNI